MIIDAETNEKYAYIRVGETFQRLEEQIIRLTLEHEQWNVTRAARTLQLAIRTVRNKMKKYGIRAPINGNNRQF